MAFTWIVPVPLMTVFEADELAGTAIGRVVISARFQRADHSVGTILGRSRDRYIRGAAGWLFAERCFELIDETPS